jgi:hypothetical protein
MRPAGGPGQTVRGLGVDAWSRFAENGHQGVELPLDVTQCLAPAPKSRHRAARALTRSRGPRRTTPP